MSVLLNIVLSNALIAAILATAAAALSRVWRNPAGNHFLWVLVLVKLITPPVFMLQIPSVVFPFTWSAAATPLPQSNIATTHREVDDSHEPRKTVTSGVKQSIKRDSAAPDELRLTPSSKSSTATTILLAIWAIGACGLAFIHTYRVRCFHALLHTAQPANSTILDLASELCKQLGVRRVPDIQMLPVRLSPLVWSLTFRPKIILPAVLFRELDTEAQQAILAHEIAHVRRLDHRTRILESLVVTLFWWHPAAWWASNSIRVLEEECADRMALEVISYGGRVYATALLDTLDFLSEGSIATPRFATAVKLRDPIARRIGLLSKHVRVRLSAGQVFFVLAVALTPMTMAFEAAPSGVRSQRGPDTYFSRKRTTNDVSLGVPFNYAQQRQQDSVPSVATSLHLDRLEFSHDAVWDPASEHPRWIQRFGSISASYLITVNNDADSRLDFVEKPVHSYLKQGDDDCNHGALFLWTRDEYPEVITSFSLHANGVNPTAVAMSQSLSSLSTHLLHASLNGKEVWTPRAAGITFKRLPYSFAPSATREGRLVQMEAIARQFRGLAIGPDKGVDDGEWQTDRPLYRYAKMKESLDWLDGAIFGLFQSGEPRVVLLLEARDCSSNPRWHFAVARMCHLPLEIEFQGQVVWSTAGTDQRQSRGTPADAYFEIQNFDTDN